MSFTKLSDIRATAGQGQSKSKDENEERGNWTGKFDFLLSCLGYAVGLGNVWRFPYMCYKNGGGAFLVPYTIFLFLVAQPVFFMDLSLGQFTSNGPLTCWEFAPLFTGIGYAMVIICTMFCIYYNMIIGYSIYFLFASMTSTLPWDSCRNDWNTQDCGDLLPLLACNTSTTIRSPDGLCLKRENKITLGMWDAKRLLNVTGRRPILPSQEYWNNKVLHISSGISEMGPCHWHLVLCLLAAWIIVFLCMIKGIKSTGKVVYFTALFPYVVLIILFFRGVTLEGAGDGLRFYLVPEFKRLADATVWKDAANQIFFSVGISWGGLIALASYNKFHNNVIRDTFIVSIGNCLTSVFAGLVIFSFLGHMAKQLNTTVDKVADKGMGLAFIIYPEAVTLLPGAPFWAILFFFMLITLGLDSQFATLETVLTAIMDRFKVLRPHKSKFTGVCCIILFLLGLPMTTSGGAYLLQLMDSYVGGWSIIFVGLCECLTIGWVYGRPGVRPGHRFLTDVRVMVGRAVSLWWRICLQAISPLLIIVVLLYAWIDYSPMKYGETEYPAWAEVIGWLMTLVSIVNIPIVAAIKVYRDDSDLNVLQRIYMLTLPSEKWGPSLMQHRMLVAPHLADSTDYLVDVDKKLKYSDVSSSISTIAGNSVPCVSLNGNVQGSSVSPTEIGSRGRSLNELSVV